MKDFKAHLIQIKHYLSDIKIMSDKHQTCRTLYDYLTKVLLYIKGNKLDKGVNDKAVPQIEITLSSYLEIHLEADITDEIAKRGFESAKREAIFILTKVVRTIEAKI